MDGMLAVVANAVVDSGRPSVDGVVVNSLVARLSAVRCARVHRLQARQIIARDYPRIKLPRQRCSLRCNAVQACETGGAKPATFAMASTAVDLTALAASTSAQLAALWTTIGVSETERADYLKQLTERVANLYTAAVQEQQSRQSLLQEEIDGLKDMIRTLHASMEQPATVVR